jgi:hypothetical protein
VLSELREIILSADQTEAQGVNSALAALYWEIGRREPAPVFLDTNLGLNRV